MPLPNFLILGTAKAGTTSVCRYLNQHPEIYMSAKENEFFSFEGSVPPPQIRAERPAITTRFTDYERLFHDYAGERVVGDCSVFYLYHERAARNIRRHVPQARLTAILRNPADRAFSAFLHQVRRGREESTDFSEALQREAAYIHEERHFMWHYTQVGFYTEQISRYLTLFGRDQLMICLYDDLNRDPLSFVKAIFRFLDVEENFCPDVSTRHNPGGLPQKKWLHRVFNRVQQSGGGFKRVVRSLAPEPLWTYSSRLASEAAHRNLHCTEIPLEVRKKLVLSFKEEILKLQDLIGRDLSAWLH